MAKLQVNISNPRNYTKTSDKKEHVKFSVTGSKEAVEAFRKDQEAKAGHECSKDEHGNPLADFLLGTAVKYGVSNTLEMITLADGTIGWQAINSEEIKLDEKTLADESTPAHIKQAIENAQAVAYMEFRKVCAQNRKAEKTTWIAKQVSNDPFTNVKQD